MHGSHRIGLISDTHGLVRPEALEALKGVERILHAGDIGSPDVLEELRKIAPVTAVRGNVDTETWARKLPKTEAVEVGGVLLYLLHNIAELDLDPATAGVRAVIYGHSHKAAMQEERGVLFLNPGSAGPRRFHLPVTVAILHMEQGAVRGEIVSL